MEGIDKKSKGKGVKDLDEIIIIEKNKDISINLTLSSLEEEIFKELSLEDVNLPSSGSQISINHQTTKAHNEVIDEDKLDTRQFILKSQECEFFDKIISEINDDISNFNPPPKLITLQPEKPSSQSLLLTSTPLSYKWIIEYDKDFKNIIVSVLTQTFIKEKEKDKEDWHALDEYDLEITDKLLYGKLLDNTHLILVTTSSIYFFDLNHNHHNGNGVLQQS
ncbi:1444_t:CDS:2 [Entrophospora sp. SA101]|nr:1444_t:CDS:2 [Entrophospora sp. SA101]